MLDTRVKELTSLFLQLDDALNTEQTKFLRIVSDYTQNRIDVFDERIREVMEERSRRQASMDAEVASIQALWKELDVSDESKAQEQVDQWIVVSLDIKLTQANLELVTERHNDLEELKARRSKESSECFETLDRLWDRLKTPEEERVEMRLLMAGLSQSTIQVHNLSIPPPSSLLPPPFASVCVKNPCIGSGLVGKTTQEDWFFQSCRNLVSCLIGDVFAGR